MDDINKNTPAILNINGKEVYSAQYMKRVILSLLNKFDTYDEIYVLTSKKEQKIKGNININGILTATKVYNAVWNDYAEFFERGENTEVGDIIALDENSDTERYVKATCNSRCIIGVHSDSFGHILGGEKAPDNVDPYEYNINKFIPVGLAGRVMCKVIGKANIGDSIVISDNYPGVGIAINSNIVNKINNKDVIGKVLQNKLTNEIALVKILIK